MKVLGLLGAEEFIVCVTIEINWTKVAYIIVSVGDKRCQKTVRYKDCLMGHS